jgi:hypothetical protein
MALGCILVGLVYFVYKLLYWNRFEAGLAPVVIGLPGEYIGAIHTQVMKRPLVIERERINFDRQNPEPHAVAMSESQRY